jgi:pilus assembly protein CpaB
LRRVLILLLALMAGAATLVLMQVGLRAPTDVAQVQPQGETVHVLVYARDLPRGTLISRGSLRWQEQLASALSPRAMVTLDADAAPPRELEGKLLRSTVLEGEMVRPELLADGAAGFMALTLSPGMRAVGISVTVQKLAGGFILPEDRVDLIHTSSGDFDGDGVTSTYSQTILENIRVLAVGETPTGRVTFQTVDQQDAMVDAQVDITAKGDTVTLEMSDEQAHLLFSAQASGQISLALRALDDQGPSRIVSRTGLDYMPPAADPEPAAAPAEDPLVVEAPPEPEELPPPTTVNVRVIQGNQTSIIEVPLVPAPISGTIP